MKSSMTRSYMQLKFYCGQQLLKNQFHSLEIEICIFDQACKCGRQIHMVRLSITILLLLSGIIAYWFFRPGIFFFDLISIHNTKPVVLYDEWLSVFFRNHYADIAWCAAVFLTASVIREKNMPRIYFNILIILPFLSEVLQGCNLIFGTFDWIDLSIYLLLYIFLSPQNFPNMQNVKKHIIGVASVLLFSFALVSSGGPKKSTYTPSPPPLPPPPPVILSKGTVTLTQQKDDIFTKPSLIPYLRSLKSPSIVLRVPGYVEKILEENKYSNVTLYHTIELEFAKADFTVRDRALFQKVLDNPTQDYSKIKELTETDFILEMISYANVSYPVNAYTDMNGIEKKTAAMLLLSGRKIEFRVIKVKDNDLVGAYTFNYAPCTKSCSYSFDEAGNLYSGGAKTNLVTTLLTSDELESFLKVCSQQLIKILKNQ
jgi:hypothetical protein